MVNFGPSILPEKIKESEPDMFWMNEMAYYHEAKSALKGYRTGEIDSTGLTPRRLRELLLATGESQREADKQAAKYHLEITRNKR